MSGASYGPATIVTGEPFRFEVAEQLAACGATNGTILIEPDARNTAAAVLAATLSIAQKDPEGLVLVLPSDHLIDAPQAFEVAALAANAAAQSGKLVTFGVTPTYAETGYGYLELKNAGDALSDHAVDLRRFVEKPNVADAEQMIATGRYLWNAGIFLFSAKAMIDAFKTHAPDILTGVVAAFAGAREDLGFLRLAADPWAKLPAISLDYAIMEKADNLAVMPYRAGWTDLGDWKSVWEKSRHDEDGNALTGASLAVDCTNSLLRAENTAMQIVGIGLDEMIVVATGDAVLVAPKSESQRVGTAVQQLKAQGARQAEQSTREQRPWGWFESLAMGNRFQVKHIRIKPGQAISLQSHRHRAEHWIVVAGTAKATINDETRMISENESIYVPLGAVHRLENPGLIPVEIIEVQTGSYLGEDDIERYADNYSRS